MAVADNGGSSIELVTQTNILLQCLMENQAAAKRETSLLQNVVTTVSRCTKAMTAVAGKGGRSQKLDTILTLSKLSTVEVDVEETLWPQKEIEIMLLFGMQMRDPDFKDG